MIKVQLAIDQYLEDKNIINLNDDIMKILEKNYLLYPHVILKDEDDILLSLKNSI